MISGTISWNNSFIRYDQTHRIIEKFLSDLKISKKINFWLESCNVCACACAVESVKAHWKCRLPSICGQNIMTQADLLFDYIYSIASGIWRDDGICENEVPQYLAKSVSIMSTAHASVSSFDTVSDAVFSMRKSIIAGHACVLSYRTDYGTGHYITAVAYDDSSDETICYDSWSDNVHCSSKGVKERYSTQFFLDRMRPRFIEISA